MRRMVCGIGWWLMAGVLAASGQAYSTPARASWTEDPSATATISWDAPAEGRGQVRYGATTNYGAVARDGGGLRRHAIVLRGLQPDTRYFYEATSTDGYWQNASFRTAPTGQVLHFALHGDLHGGVDVAWAQSVADEIRAEDPQWIVQMGDLSDEAYGGSGFGTWTNFFQICSNELARSVFMPIPGNHDDPGGPDAPEHERGLYHRLFALPEPSLGAGSYAYAAGPARFICLNTEEGAAAQTNWLARELQAAANDTNATWVLPVLHRPPYSQGDREGWGDGKTNWSPLFVQYEADWVFCGHSHNYQRTVPIRGVRYLVTGGGGAWPYEAAYGEPMLAFTTTCFHHVSCHVTGATMQVRAIRSDGLVFDSEVVENRRQVRVSPAFPLRGQPAKISYRATEGPLAAADPVHIHLGLDGFAAAWTNAAMDWNAAAARWEYEFTVPDAATSRLAFAFCDAAGTNWHNNYDHNWQALLGRVCVTPSPPAAGSDATVRYEADMGPLAGSTQVLAWVAFDGAPFAATNGRTMTNVSGARWECAVPVPSSARSMALAFSSGSGWDDDYRRTFRFAVAGAAADSWPAAPIAAAGTPVITEDPAGDLPNHVGDNFDLAMEGPPLSSQDAPRGFGDWGRVWVNVDSTNLYLGGMGADLGGSNNVFLLFLGCDTLTDNAWNLWHKTGVPNALDFLHNVRFAEPMDIALVLGDQYGDGPAYTNFIYGGYDFGQGVFYIGTNCADLVPLQGAVLSQFDGTGTVACATAGDAEHRATTRWEAAIPWSALGASGPEPVSNLFLCGVIGSGSLNGNDRYLSRTFLGERAWGDTDGFGEFGYHTVSLRPARVNLLHADLLGDGLSNAWRQEYFGTPAGPSAEEDSDGDGQDNRSEEAAGTHPLDGDSLFEVEEAAAIPGAPVTFRWPFAEGRAYDVSFTSNLFQPFLPLATGLSTNGYEPDSSGFYQIRVRK